MREIFLEKEQNLMLRIVEELYKSPTREITCKDLAEKLAIDKRSVSRLINDIIDCSKKQGNPHFVYEKNILRELAPNPPHPQELLNQMLKMSIKFQIIEKLFFETNTNVLKMCYDLNISRSVFQRRVSELHRFMKTFDINFTFYSNEPLRGDESQIRYFFHSLFWEVKESEYIKESPELQNVTTLLLNINPDIDYFTLKRLQLSVTIMQHRTKYHHYIMRKERFIIEDHPFIGFTEFYNKMKTTNIFSYCPDEATAETECRYLYFVFCGIDLIPLSKLTRINYDINKYHDEIVETYLDFLQIELPFKLTNIEKNYIKINQYYLHKTISVFKGHTKVYGMENFSAKFQNLMPRDYQKMLEIIDVFSAKNSKIRELKKRIPSFYQVYGMILCIIFANHKQKLKVLIQTKVSPLQLEFISWIIKSVALFPIEVVTIASLGKEEPDAIISDYIPPLQYKNVPFYNLSTIAYNDAFSGLELFICNIVDGKFMDTDNE
ncbi:MAG: helix-turn-helix domain-containing protein [Lachnospiraceae bacterium]|jgi:predicted transcriptional regulator|nr:helix-turn-helix domain-containing protein [Lachnospiraceae bacterium]